MSDLPILNIRLQPNASIDEFYGWMGDDVLKVRVKGKPVEGQANENLIAFLSKKLDIPKRNIRIIAGERSRNKRIVFEGITKTELDKRIRSLLDQEP
jgi:uncharacterized protein (TIGR00251 family)